MPRWVACVSYTGECCERAHLWALEVQAETVRGARGKALRAMRKEDPDIDINDVVIIGLPDGKMSKTWEERK